jgi:hypothetical protein
MPTPPRAASEENRIDKEPSLPFQRSQRIEEDSAECSRREFDICGGATMTSASDDKARQISFKIIIEWDTFEHATSIFLLLRLFKWISVLAVF